MELWLRPTPFSNPHLGKHNDWDTKVNPNQELFKPALIALAAEILGWCIVDANLWMLRTGRIHRRPPLATIRGYISQEIRDHRDTLCQPPPVRTPCR